MDTSLASGARYVAAAGGGKRRWVTLPAPDSRQPIAEILGNVAGEASYGSGDRLRVLRDEVAPFLGVKLLRERRRADEVAEEDRQLDLVMTGSEMAAPASG